MEANFILKKTCDLSLHDAVKKGDIKAVRSLVNLGIDVNYKNSVGQTPLHLAIKFENAKILNFLLSLTNKIDSHLKDNCDDTALDYAIKKNNLKLVEILLQAHTAFATDENTNAYETALHFSIERNYTLLFENLFSKVDVNAKDRNGWTPLHSAALYNKNESHLHIVDVLLKSGANINAQEHNGYTPLHLIAGKANIKIVQLFLNYKLDINIKDDQDETPLNKAVSNKNFDVVQLLVNNGANVNSVAKNGVTVLHEACTNYNEKIIKLLVKNSANIHALTSYKWTPFDNILKYFSFSSTCERPGRIMLFLLKYININIANNFLKILSPENFDIWRVILEHIAKLHVLNIYIDQSIFNKISNNKEFSKYFNTCNKELLLAKNIKIQNCWITYFNLLVDSQRELKNYAGNQDLVENFTAKDILEKFPVYGNTICKNVTKGIKRRKVFDKASITLSNCLPIFNSNHLIIKNILDCIMNVKDLTKLC